MFTQFKAFLNRDHATTLADVTGCALVVTGIDYIAGTGAAFIASGIAILVLSYLVA